MERIIVTVGREGETQTIDLELPADLPLEALAQEIALGLGWSGSLQVYAEPPGRVLQPHESLAQADVWDGAWLTFQPAGSAPPGGGFRPMTAAPAAGPARGEADSPVGGWRPLDLNPPPGQNPPPSSPSGGFTWKQIDED